MINKKEKILSLLENTYCRLRPSKIEGIGVFAIRNIPKNMNPFLGIQKQKWSKIKLLKLMDLDKEVLKMIDDFFTVNEKTVYLPELGLNGMDISFFLNSSKTPNVKIKDDEVNFITTKNIKKGEELTVSYKNFYERRQTKNLVKKIYQY